MDVSKFTGSFTKDGKFLMLALDHRGSIKKLMNPQDPDSITDEEVIDLKNEIIESVKNEFSALLIDEVWGLEACHEVCRVKPFLLPLERSGYDEQNGERLTELEYSVEKIKEMGASGAKLLLYFNPKANSTDKQLETAKLVMEDCRNNDFPLFLEIVTYGEGEGLVAESVKKFQEEGIVPSVWKLEYPGSEEKCQEITDLVGDTPWILLTGGQTFDEFTPELETAVKVGASGFLAGRALWQEVCKLEGEEKQKFLNETLKNRFKIIAEML